MDTSDGDPRTPASWRRPFLACLASLGAVGLAVAVLGIATAVEQRAHPPTCYGIGFGCTPDAGATAALVAMFVGAPVVAAAWLLTVLGWLVTRRRSDRANRAATWWPAWTLTGGLAVLVALATVTAG